MVDKSDYGFIFLYVAAFGFCDYLVEHFKIKGIKYFSFYTLILIIGLLIVYS